jgi:hypothetical protein
MVTSSRVCLFNIPSPSTDVHLVLRIEKILAPDMKGVSEAYVKVDPTKPKDVSKWKKSASSACSTVPFKVETIICKFIMFFTTFDKAPFGFAILPLFNNHEEFVGGKNVKFLQVFRQALTSGEVGDEALIRVFAADQKSTTKKMKTIPATLTCTMEDVSDTLSEIPGLVETNKNNFVFC